MVWKVRRVFYACGSPELQSANHQAYDHLFNQLIINIYNPSCAHFCIFLQLSFLFAPLCFLSAHTAVFSTLFALLYFYLCLQFCIIFTCMFDNDNIKLYKTYLTDEPGHSGGTFSSARVYQPVSVYLLSANNHINQFENGG